MFQNWYNLWDIQSWREFSKPQVFNWRIWSKIDMCRGVEAIQKVKNKQWNKQIHCSGRVMDIFYTIIEMLQLVYTSPVNSTQYNVNLFFNVLQLLTKCLTSWVFQTSVWFLGKTKDALTSMCISNHQERIYCEHWWKLYRIWPWRRTVICSWCVHVACIHEVLALLPFSPYWAAADNRAKTLQ